ncbi:MAG: sulfatase-like hydrolase/transferase [Candidatus Aminicenantes bacterium]|jgi:arylsulfatase A-like enzyme/Flp pilus assembly protein TadD
MTKGYFFVILLLCLIWWGVSCKESAGGEAKGPHPPQPKKTQRLKVPGKDFNILLITLDTLRADRLSVYSDKYVKTPNIDRLAAKSFIFTRAFSHNPVTLPAHTNILTGTTPRFHGISDNTGFRLEDRFLTIAEYLKEAGYHTGAFIGAFPLDSRFGLNQGFDLYDDQYGTHNQLEFFFVERPAQKVIEPAVQWISQQRSGPGKHKWFAWVHLFDPHQPYLPPAPYHKEYRHDLYSGEVAYTDASLKVLFDFLEDDGLPEDTVIVVTGDHGEALGEKGEKTHAYFAYNNTILIPLLLYIPDTVTSEKGIKIDENVCHADIFPTICDILHRDIPGHLQGESLLPLIENHLNGGSGSRNPRMIYFESLTPYLNRGWAPLRGFVRGDIKFIDLPIIEVYNIKDDIHETRNIALGPNIKQLKRDLVKLKNDLKGKSMMQRSARISPQERKKLESLGYISGTPSAKSRVFTEAEDLKTMLPLQNRMLTAVANYRTGGTRQAVTQLRSIVEESPGFVLVYRHMATIYQETGQVGKAIEILEYGLKKNPGNTELMSKLGIMLAEARQPDKAIEILNVCIKKNPFNPDNFNFLGVAYYKKGNAAKAMENYRKALELDNNYASVFNNIGSLYLALYLGSKKKDERVFQLAMENFNRALEIDPRLFAAYNGRGAAYKFKNQVKKAIADWKKTIEINPNYIDAYFNIGISYLQIGDKASALKHLLLCKEKLAAKLPAKDRQQLERLIAQASQ